MIDWGDAGAPAAGLDLGAEIGDKEDETGLGGPPVITDILLFADAVLKLAMGALLVAFSGRLIAALGLPAAGSTFYPRLLGGALLGVGVALLMTAMPTGWAGLGIHGAAAVNLLMAGMLVLLLIGRAGRPSAAGQRLLWGLAAVQLGLGGLEWLIFGG